MSNAERQQLVLLLITELGLIHSQCIIHNDVKPQNIVVYGHDKTLRVKMIDFDLSVWFRTFNYAKDLCVDLGGRPLKSSAGTRGYNAPEKDQKMNETISPRSDVYSAGIVCAEVLAGKLFGHKSKGVQEFIKKGDVWGVLIEQMTKNARHERLNVSQCFEYLIQKKVCIIGTREELSKRLRITEPLSL